MDREDVLGKDGKSLWLRHNFLYHAEQVKWQGFYRCQEHSINSQRFVYQLLYLLSSEYSL